MFNSRLPLRGTTFSLHNRGFQEALMRTLFLSGFALSVASRLAVSQTGDHPGRVIDPGAGERLTYCARPLDLTLKVDSETAPSTHLVAGIGELRGDEGDARHASSDEILYVVDGWGHVTVGADSIRLAPGSVIYVPPGLGHRLVSTGPRPMTYFFVLGPQASASGLRRASMTGCAGKVASMAGTAAVQPNGPVAIERRAVWIDPGAGDRITYCLFPLTITTKIDSATAPGTRLTTAVGVLRRGAEFSTHASGDEVALFTHGSGRAFIGADTVAVRAGSVTFVPQATVHGFINDGEGTLEYVVIYQRGFSPAGFRRLAARPGAYCPATVP
jgi:mannose-6-phosphate isomerase-like protein (cupin superfamily)